MTQAQDRGVQALYDEEIDSPIGSLVIVASRLGLCAVQSGTWADNRDLKRSERWAEPITGIRSLFIPCHRVIGANGELVGYRGGLDIKVFLLE